MEQAMNQRGEVTHGAFDARELALLGLRLEDILDFSVNSNPYGSSPLVREALAQTALDRYPDRFCLDLRRVLLATELSSYTLSSEALVCGNGASELIWAIARAYLHAGQCAALIGPTFGEYAAASRAAGAVVVEYRTTESTAFTVDGAALSSWLHQEHPALVWLCNPNNPTGTWLSPEDLIHLHETCQQMRAVFVIDEAYWRFLVPQESFSALDLLQTDLDVPLIVIRSLTKDLALAGLRLGYAVGSSVQVVQRINAHLPSWNVNAFAQQAGIAALQDQTYLRTTLAHLELERQAFLRALQEARLQVLPSRTHFFLLAVEDATRVRQRLLTQHLLLVRDGTSFGLPRYIRVATRPKADWQRLLHALPEVL